MKADTGVAFRSVVALSAFQTGSLQRCACMIYEERGRRATEAYGNCLIPIGPHLFHVLFIIYASLVALNTRTLSCDGIDCLHGVRSRRKIEGVPCKCDRIAFSQPCVGNEWG